MIKTLIIDDEKLARENIKILIERISDKFVISGEASNIVDAIKLYNSTKPEVVFLDINMPNGSGFDFLECIDFDNTKVIMATAYEDFALKAIKYQVFDYLVKPIDIDIFEVTIENILKTFKSKGTIKSNKISFSTSDEIVYVEMEDILYCESDNSYCTIYLKNNEHIVISSSLSKVQEKLNSNFFRCHQSFLINKKEIVKYYKLENKVLLSNGNKIPISKINKKELMELFNS